MGQRPCCRSCRHCAPPNGVEMGWCQLRQLPIHPDLVAQLWCHHWTSRPPRLPVVAQAEAVARSSHPTSNRQLQLDTVLSQGQGQI